MAHQLNKQLSTPALWAFLIGISTLLTAACSSGPQRQHETRASLDKSQFQRVSEKSSEHRDGFVLSPLTNQGHVRCRLSGDEAIRTWQDRADVAHACALSQDWLRVEEHARLLARQTPDSPWGAYFLSLSAEARGRVHGALWFIELALKKDDTVGALHFQKARLLALDGDHDLAKESLDLAISLDPALMQFTPSLNSRLQFTAQKGDQP